MYKLVAIHKQNAIHYKIQFTNQSRFTNQSQWVVPENICTPTTGDILEFRMHGGLLGLEFRMHEGVSSPGILKGGGGG